jgi:hypothetical protein
MGLYATHGCTIHWKPVMTSVVWVYLLFEYLLGMKRVYCLFKLIFKKSQHSRDVHT